MSFSSTLMWKICHFSVVFLLQFSLLHLHIAWMHFNDMMMLFLWIQTEINATLLSFFHNFFSLQWLVMKTVFLHHQYALYFVQSTKSIKSGFFQRNERKKYDLIWSATLFFIIEILFHVIMLISPFTHDKREKIVNAQSIHSSWIASSDFCVNMKSKKIINWSTGKLSSRQRFFFFNFSHWHALI